MTTSTRQFCDGIRRRDVLRLGSIGLFGSVINLPHVLESQARAAAEGKPARDTSMILLFLRGGLSTIDTWDIKPHAPAEIRGEFNPISTHTPGIQICEHLPLLAQRSHLWALVRSLTHNESGHDRGTYLMLTGNTVVPPSFRAKKPQSSDLPSIAAVAGYSTKPRVI